MPPFDDDGDRAWSASGLAALTGRPDGPPLSPPAGFVARARALGRRVEAAAAAVGAAVTVPVLERCAERAALLGLHRGGTASCGGATRLLRAHDGWLAVALPRPDDVELIPAWLGVTAPADEPWPVVAAAVGATSTRALLPPAIELGLAVAALGERRSEHGGDEGPAPPVASGARAAGRRVVDLSSLWAGPLCGSLLADAGADVVKVEATTRPDGARSGPPAFFDLLNAGKRSVALDLTTGRGRTVLQGLIDQADVVIEASRPRALEQLGIDVGRRLRHDRPVVWVSITAHGRDGGRRHRIGFGDDTAVAGGLVAWEDGEPRFLGDAVADPLTGLTAAAATFEAMAKGGSRLVDVNLAGVAAWFASPLAGPARAASAPATEPRAVRPRGTGPPLGAHTGDVLADWQVPC